MNESMRVGIIGGGGWLGRAFAEAMLDAGFVSPDRLTLSYRSARPDVLPDAVWTRDNAELIDRSDVVIVSVRPQDLGAVKGNANGKLVISVMAGKTIDEIFRHFHTDRIVRTLPNAAAEVRKSYTPWIASRSVGESDKALVRRILEAYGSADEVRMEADIDYFTGLTGSGPAFPALLATAMMDDAMKRGIDRGVARRAVNALLVGAGQLLAIRDEDPADLVQVFLDYQGTTAAAIRAMRAGGFDAAVAHGLEAAFQKSVIMGQAS